MAYAGEPTTTRHYHPLYGRYYVVELSETGAAAASEYTITGIPSVGTITHFQATLTAGTGTTIQPKLGKSAGWSADSQDVIADQDAAAASINDPTFVRYTLDGGKNVMYGRSVVDAGSDNAITTILTIVEGHIA